MPACVKLRANGTFSILTIRVRLSAIPAVHKLHRETSEVLRSCTCTTGHIRMPAGYNRKPAPVQRPVSATDAGKNGGAGGSSAPETPEQVFTPKQDRRGSRSLDEVRCRFSCLTWHSGLTALLLAFPRDSLGTRALTSCWAPRRPWDLYMLSCCHRAGTHHTEIAHLTLLSASTGS